MVSTLIIGSSRGIGLGITEKLLKENHKVFGVSRNTPNIISDKYHHTNLDISCSDAFGQYLTSQNLNDYDNFIICAGNNDVAALRDINIERVISLYKINLFPAFQLLKYIDETSNMRRKSIVLISSIWSSFGIPGRSMYGSSKAALVALTKHASAELSHRSIYINCISPGFTNTELSSKTAKDPEIEKELVASSYEGCKTYSIAVPSELTFIKLPALDSFTPGKPLPTEKCALPEVACSK